MKIAYCDDETAQAIYVREVLERWQQEVNEEFEFTVYSSAEEMLFEHPDTFLFDLILLDIELNQMNGVELARKIRSIDESVGIVFLSNKKEYVFEGYEVQAIRYLLKPLQYEQMKPVLTKIQDSRNKEKKHVIVASGGESHKIYQKDIRYIEAVGHYMHIVTKEEEYSCKMTLSSIYKSLDVDQFIYTHRSYIVNLSYLLQIKKTECLLEGGKIVPVSRSLYKEVNQAFIRFYKDGMQL